MGISRNPFFRIPSVIRIGLLGCFLLLNCLVYSQTPEVKKSTRIDKIDGKKYYMHTVEQGQTLFAIAKAYFLDVNDIVLDNPDAIDGIKPGQVLKIPLSKSVRNTYSPPSNSKEATHKVEAGQTLYSISKQYNTTVDMLRSLNPELKDGLKAGMVLKLPSGSKEQKVAQESNVGTKIDPKDQRLKESSDVTELPGKTDTLFSLKKQDSYNVALFAPFHFENNDNIEPEKIIKDAGQVPAKTEMALQFYQGFKLAMDSIRRTGLKVQLYVYDVDDADSARIREILRKPELANMNLIMGPLTSNCFSLVARFARQKNIPIVSPTSTVNKILLNNEYVSKLTPSVTTQLEEQAAYIAKNYKDENIILITNSKPKEAQYQNAFRTAYENILAKKTTKDSLRQSRGGESLSKSISSSRVNVVVIPSGDQVFVTDMLRMLNTLAEKNNIVVFGMQSWKSFPNIDYDYLNKLHLHFAASSFVDYDNDATVNFVKNYRIAYDQEPGQTAFQGYDAGLYYLNALRVYGLQFDKKLPSLKWTGLQSAIDLYKTSPESGLENKAVNMVMIQDYKLIKAN